MECAYYFGSLNENALGVMTTTTRATHADAQSAKLPSQKISI